MKRKSLILVLAYFALMLSGQVMAQEHRVGRLESALDLYRKGAFYSAEQMLNLVTPDPDSDISIFAIQVEAYKTMCAIRLDRSNIAGLVKNFEDRYPNAPELQMVKFALASRLFDREEYAAALVIYDSIKKPFLYAEEQIEYDFKSAYCYIRAGDTDVAARRLTAIIEGDFSPFSVPSQYYLGYVRYLEKDFASALPLFRKAEKDPRFSVLASYYTVESEFMLGNYRYVIDRGPAIFSTLDRDLQVNLARIVSEAYFSMGQPTLAAQYFDMFSTSGGNLTRKDHYYSGLLSYTLQSFKQAIESFSNVVGNEDALGQSAYYYSANSSLRLHNKIAAMEAFKAASESDFDSVIKEDALFNHAKLSFDVNGDISGFENYMELYPESGKDDIINNYIAAAFLLSNDYNSAVTALTKIRELSDESSANLQKAAFFRAMQLIENRGYRSAVPMLELSIENGRHDPRLEALANYWLAESHFRNGKYRQATDINLRLMENPHFLDSEQYRTAVYNLAYSYFMWGKFASAQQWFSEYLGMSGRKQFERDARIRLADSYFMQNNYTDAAATYERVFNRYPTSSDLYPAYQGAVSYGLLGNDTRKISILRQALKINRNAELYSQCLFELGRTLVQRGADDDAADCFHTLIGHDADSIFFTKSMLELAMINANNGKYTKAIEYYKNIIEGMPLSPEVPNAISGMESVYQTINKPEEYFAYLETLGMSDIKSADEKELMLFNAAEHRYLSGNYNSAITSLQSFVKNYPSGSKTAQAYYYLAESLKAKGRKEAASDAYFKVIKLGEGPFAEAATLNYADISYELEHYPTAVTAYESLIYIASTENMKNTGYFGRMRSYYNNKQYEEAVADAKRVIGVSELPDEMRREAEYITAKSLLYLDNREEAKPILNSLSRNPHDNYGAEATYLLITDAYGAGDFLAVENRVYDFSDSETSQIYWLAKAFIILGDSFADRGDVEQARATYESVLEGYQPTGDADDVKEQVKMRLDKLK
ncbi:MAG TPA: tetratricopeptide repeat protein [Bacteroidales bacterium]|nr:tetratricopeptide repeat protein [Bacteroidales bacterium]HKM12752.1 tetratricopeptide repeat protein [Bacteroidales bacterium]HPB88878.1 tetratricopeptide repeat protein [Bacteroidales bacterium]HPH52975.1 tetratricopeptide repeat protein [Bacteroidales bacterium]HPY21169.1 tetratricopeptide repeat protein [Bacteroidales bacterium]